MATVQDIIDRVTFVTKDLDANRWSLGEVVTWLKDAIDQIATIHPRVASQYVTVALREGSRQDLRMIDAGRRWIRLHEVTCNVDGANAPAGYTIRQVARPSLFFSLRRWTKPPATEVREYAIDEREVNTFDVYPPVAAGTRVMVLASIKPAPIEDEDSEFPLPDGYDIAATDYVLYRLFSKDASDQTYAARATGHLQAFNLSMGLETKDASGA